MAIKIKWFDNWPKEYAKNHELLAEQFPGLAHDIHVAKGKYAY